VLFFGEYPSLDYTMQVDCRIDRVWQVPELANAGLVFRSPEPAKDNEQAVYGFGIAPFRTRFAVVGQGGGWHFEGASVINHNIGQWYKLKLVVSDNKFVGYVDDEPVCKIRNNQFRGRFVGLGMGSNIDASFDDFMITDQVDEDALLHFDVSPEGMLATTWAGLKAR
jgi:hypothetical protein